MKKADAWLFYSGGVFEKRKERGYIRELEEKAMNEFGIKLEIKNAHKFIMYSGNKNELYYEGKKVKNLPKFAIFRRYDIYLARHLESLGVSVFNNVQAMIDARNKMKVHQILASKNICIPQTIYISPKKKLSNINYEAVCKVLKNNKFIMKWIYGSQGTHVFLVDNKEEFDKIIHKYAGKVLCQEYIENSYGTDIRAYIIGGKYIGAAIRKSETDFRSNLAKGGEAKYFKYNKRIEKIAIEAANAIGLEICGVDILIGKNNKYYICEVNSVPGFKSVKSTLDIDEKTVFLNLIRDKMNAGEECGLKI